MLKATIELALDDADNLEDNEKELIINDMYHILNERIRLSRQKNNGSGSITNGHAAITKALVYIHENYDKDISLVNAAEHVYLNPSYFGRLFKVYVGKLLLII